MKKLSVIIPVYNIKDYLPQCIDSLLCDMADYEILLVDDGSTDGSSLVCDEYANRYDFIEVYHKENGGVSSARNLGLDKARGEYIYFVDGDDWVEGFNSIFSMLDGSELFGVNYDVVDKECHVVKSHAPECEKIAVNDYSRYYERHSHALWAFIFRKKIIDRLQLRFCKDLKYAEDWVFVVGYLSQICSIKTLPEITYKYRMSREGSAMNQIYDSRQILLHFKAFDLIEATKPIPECKRYYNKELQECFSYVLNIVIKNLAILDKKQMQKMIRNRLSLTILSTYNLKFMFKTITTYMQVYSCQLKCHFKVLREFAYRLRFLLHYIVYHYVNNTFTTKDLESFNKGLFNNPHCHSLAFILAKYPEFRNLFYYRYRDNKIWVSVLSLIASPDPTFRICTDYLGYSPMFYHSFATILNCKHIGDNVIVRNNTTIGNKNLDKKLRPTIGDNVDIGVNSVIIGNIKIGNNVIIGAGSVVIKDTPDNCIIAGNPAKIIKYIQ